MKKSVPALVVLLSTLLFSMASQANNISFSLNPTSNSVQVGDHLSVELLVNDLFANADPDEWLLAFGLNLQNSNIHVLQFEQVTVNPLFSDDSAALGLDAAGSAFPGIANTANAPVFSLATLHFLALNAGNSTIAIASDLQDANQGLWLLNQGQLAIQASQSITVSNVPVPAAAWLFISGILSLVAVKKRIS